MIYLGIDPGISGGMVALLPNGLILTTKMPDVEDEEETLEWLKQRRIGFTHTTLEEISPAHFGTGKASMSKLYGHYRALRMALVALEIPFRVVKASEWHRALAIPPRKKGEAKTIWKQRLKVFAQSLYPDVYLTLATCDALLLAHYGKTCYEKERP